MTKINLLRLLIAAITLNIVAASHAQAPIAVRWDMGHNEAQKGWYSSKFVIKNVSGKVLGAIRPRIELLRKRFIDAKLPHAFLLDIVLTETAGLEVKP